MLTIRFARVGKKNRPQFKIALQEHTIAPGGTHVEILGSYDPHRKQAVLKEERIKYWIGHGVQLSDTVHNLLIKEGILSGEKRKVKIPAKKIEEVATEALVTDKSEVGPTEKKEEAQKTEVAAEDPTQKKESKPKEAKAE